jgi:hypothetical protein
MGRLQLVQSMGHVTTYPSSHQKRLKTESLYSRNHSYASRFVSIRRFRLTPESKYEHQIFVS